MDDPVFVRHFEHLGDLLRERQRLVWWNRSPGDAIGQRWPLDQLQHQGLNAGGFLESMNRGDVRMVQRGQQLRFAPEPCEAIRIGCELCGQNLERHIAIQPRVASAEYLAHAAGAKRLNDFVRAHAPAGLENWMRWRRTPGSRWERVRISKNNLGRERQAIKKPDVRRVRGQWRLDFSAQRIVACRGRGEERVALGFGPLDHRLKQRLDARPPVVDHDAADPFRFDRRPTVAPSPVHCTLTRLASESSGRPRRGARF